MMSTGGSDSPFTTSGVLARPAGLPCGALAAAPGYSAIRIGSMSARGDMTMRSSSRPFGMPAVVAPSNWHAKEASVHPTHKESPAGLDSVVDNTVRYKPLPPRYGKTREISPMEMSPVMRSLAPDLLAESKGLRTNALPIVRESERIGAVLGPYAANAPIYGERFDPERRRAGFLNTPVNLGCSTYVDEETTQYKMQKSYQAPSPSADNMWTAKKFAFDRTANIAHIPVAKRVGAKGIF